MNLIENTKRGDFGLRFAKAENLINLIKVGLMIGYHLGSTDTLEDIVK